MPNSKATISPQKDTPQPTSTFLKTAARIPSRTASTRAERSTDQKKYTMMVLAWRKQGRLLYRRLVWRQVGSLSLHSDGNLTRHSCRSQDLFSIAFHVLGDAGIAQVKGHLYHIVFYLLSAFRAFEGCIHRNSYCLVLRFSLTNSQIKYSMNETPSTNISARDAAS